MERGYSCSSEEFEASQLVRVGRRAEEAGFDFVTVSDHYHPWTSTQGHSPFAWSTLAALAACTERVGHGGQAGVGGGTGEALNEHVTGARWPPVEVRIEMLVEAVQIIRSLWTGETTDIRGDHFTVENARLFSAPDHPIDIVWAAAGEESAARATALRQWPNAALGGQLGQDLPTWTHFEHASALAREQDVAERVVCGADPERIVAAVEEFVKVGADRIHFHQVGSEQDAFIRAFEADLRPALTS